MADTFKVGQVVEKGAAYTFTGRDGDEVTLVPYQLLLDGEREPVQLNQLPDTPAPKEGDELVGHIAESKRGRTFKKENPQFRASNGQPDQFDRRPDHPQTQERMRHTTALSAAPAYIEQMLTIKVADQPKDWDGYWALVEQVVAKLEATYPGV